MEITVKQRLIEYLEFKKIGRNKFEKMAGLSLGYITKLKNAPRPEKLVDILQSAPDLNRTWLLTGEGNMLLDSDVTLIPPTTMKEYTVTKAGMKFYKRDDGQLLMEVPVLPIAALGSPEDEFATLCENDDCDKIPFEVDEVHHGHYFAFKVEGNSMDDGTYNGFRSGDTVLVRELPRDEWAPQLHISKWPYWVIVWGNNVRLKEIVSQDTEVGTITLHSLNPSPEYTDFTLSLSGISRMFNVIQVQPKIRKI